jgi:hypothetical protein
LSLIHVSLPITRGRCTISQPHVAQAQANARGNRCKWSASPGIDIMKMLNSVVAHARGVPRRHSCRCLPIGSNAEGTGVALAQGKRAAEQVLAKEI